jgi:hypothetical protein
MTFNRLHATQQVRAMTREELDLAIHVLCSAFNAQRFPGIDTLQDVHEMVSVLAKEKQRRDVFDTLAQTEPRSFARPGTPQARPAEPSIR